MSRILFPINCARRTKIFEVSLLLVVLLTMNGVSIAANSPAEEIKPNTHRLVITDFELIGVSRKLRFLGRGFSDILQTALLPYHQLEVIPRGTLWDALRKLDVPYEDRSPRRIFNTDVLNSPSVNAKYLLTGKLVGFGEKLQLNLELLNRENDEVSDLGPYMITANTIFQTTEDVLALDINDFVAKTGLAEDQPQKTVFLCIEDQSKNVSRQMPFLIPDLKSSLASRLANDYQIDPVVSYESTYRCAADAMASTKWKSINKIAVLIDAKLDWIKNDSRTRKNLIIRSVMRVNRKNINISLLDLKNNYAINKSDRTLKSDFLTVASKYISKTFDDAGLAQLEYLSYVDTASRADPNLEADLVQGILRYNSGDDVFSLPYFQRVKNIDANNSMANYYIGRVLADNREYDDSIDFYDTAISGGEKKMPEVHQSLGNVYYEKGDFIKAKEHYKAAISTGGAKVDAIRGLAYIHLMNDDLDMARKYFLQILEKSPNDLDSINSISVISIKQQNYKVAVKWLNKALLLDKDNARAKSNLSLAYQHLAQIAYKNDEIDNAILYLGKDIEINASNNIENNNYSKLKRSQLYIKKAALEDASTADKAILDLRKLVQQYDNNAKLEDLQYAKIDLAMAVIMSGDYGYAERLTEEVLRRPKMEAEQRIFVRMLNISAKLLLDTQPNYELGALSKELTSVRRPRKISEALNERYFTFYNFTANTNRLNNDMKQELENISLLAKGNAEPVASSK